MINNRWNYKADVKFCGICHTAKLDTKFNAPICPLNVIISKHFPRMKFPCIFFVISHTEGSSSLCKLMLSVAEKRLEWRKTGVIQWKKFHI